MNRREAWALVALAAAAMVISLVLLRAYNPGGLLFYTIALYAIAVVLFLNIRRISRRKQAS